MKWYLIQVPKNQQPCAMSEFDGRVAVLAQEQVSRESYLTLVVGKENVIVSKQWIRKIWKSS